MQIFFHHGDIHWKKLRTQSNWREFEFMFHQVQSSIMVTNLSLKETLVHWDKFSRDLSEAKRKRRPQLEKYDFSRKVF